jgi:hypothetical protein
MKYEFKHAWYSLLRLFKFLFWYGAAVAAMFLLLPVAGAFLQEQYEALSGTARMAAVAGFFLVVAVWHLAGRRKEMMKVFAKKNDLPAEEASRS